jgi:hypothetical protein
MKKIFLIAASLLVLNTNPASACSCIQTTPQQSLKNSKVVFAGRVIDVVEQRDSTDAASGPSLAGVKVTFDASQVWKGKPDRQMVITTSGSSASCGYFFEKGKEYLVYANGQGTQLQTGLCSGTKPLSNAQADLAVLGRGISPTPQNPSAAQLQRNKQLWAKQNISKYRYTLRRSCFCLPKATEPVMIAVRNGKVTSIVAASNGQPANPEYFTKYDSIAKLFEIVEDAIARKAYRLSVTYHPTLGYPTKIDIDYDKQMADEELSLTIENLQALK